MTGGTLVCSSEHNTNVNADIMLLPKLISIVKSLPFRKAINVFDYQKHHKFLTLFVTADDDELQDIVNGMKAEGFRFISDDYLGKPREFETERSKYYFEYPYQKFQELLYARSTYVLHFQYMGKPIEMKLLGGDNITYKEL